jgi:hypothetical protein
MPPIRTIPEATVYSVRPEVAFREASAPGRDQDL